MDITIIAIIAGLALSVASMLSAFFFAFAGPTFNSSGIVSATTSYKGVIASSIVCVASMAATLVVGIATVVIHSI